MEKQAKFTSVLNYITSGVLWILGLLTLLFNISGLWKAWHLAGFGVVFVAPFAIIVNIVALVCSVIITEKPQKRKYLIINGIAFAVSVFFVIFTVLVSATWFW